jgi:hypothetical protein
MRPGSLVRAFTVALLCFASLARGQDRFASAHQTALAANPSGLHLKISFDPGQTTFHIGDTIKLNYELTADSPGKYVAGSRFFDRSTRSTLETFVVDRPAAASDPLREFWDLYTALYCSHYDSNRDPTLKLVPDSPQRDSFEITHYLRFKQPGTYRLYAITRSVVQVDANPREHAGPPLVSENFVTFQILPQDLTAAAKEVDAIFAKAHQQTSPRFLPADAFRLFEISTPQARTAAADLYTRRNNYPDADSIALATVLAPPSHTAAITLLDARLRNPALVIDEDLLLDLSLLRFIRANPKVTSSPVLTLPPVQSDPLREILARYRLSDFRAALATLDGRSPDIRASSARALDHLAGYSLCSKPLSESLSAAEYQKLHQLHLATLPDLPNRELTYELLNFGWAKDFSQDQVLPVLVQIYKSPPKENASFIRETTLHVIEKYDPAQARTLFREQVLNFDAPLDWNRIRSLNLPTGPDLDADLIRVLEDRWTERMTRVAPVIGLYATDSILDRVKKVYEVDGPNWPCSIEAGLLTYFLRVDPAYGTQKLGPALEAYNLKGASDCQRGHLLVDLAVLRHAPELRPFAESALNDPRPLVAAAGAQVTSFLAENTAFTPCDKLVARLRILHDEWPDFDPVKSDSALVQKWNSGYNELERMISINLVNASDSPEHAAAWKQALDLCVTDSCRNMLRQRLARSRF